MAMRGKIDAAVDRYWGGGDEGVGVIGYQLQGHVVAVGLCEQGYEDAADW